jgi:branched-chain amino acid transport system permease protein
MTTVRQQARATADAAGTGRIMLPPGTAAAASWLAVLIALLIALSFTLNTSNLLTVEEALGFAVFAVATNLLVGYGGLVSFGQAAFFGTGAYTVALGWQNYHRSFWEGFLLAPVVGGVLALVVGLLALRARFLYFALLTLAFSHLFYEIVELSGSSAIRP